MIRIFIYRQGIGAPCVRPLWQNPAFHLTDGFKTAVLVERKAGFRGGQPDRARLLLLQE